MPTTATPKPRTTPARTAGPDELTIVIRGHNPAPQGSKAPVTRTRGDGRRVTALREQSKRVKPWRAVVAAHARHTIAQTGGTPMDGALRAEIIFTMTPPKNRPKTRRTWPNTRASGDIDKLQRSTLDGISDDDKGRALKAIADDSRICDIRAMKLYPGDPGALDEPGAVIRITRLDTQENPTP